MANAQAGPRHVIVVTAVLGNVPHLNEAKRLSQRVYMHTIELHGRRLAGLGCVRCSSWQVWSGCGEQGS